MQRLILCALVAAAAGVAASRVRVQREGVDEVLKAVQGVQQLSALGGKVPAQSYDAVLGMLHAMYDEIKEKHDEAQQELEQYREDWFRRRREMARASYDIPLVAKLINETVGYNSDTFGIVNTFRSPHRDCKEARAMIQNATSGFYWIYGHGGKFDEPFPVYCDMERDGGGWTLVLKTWYQSGVAGKAGAVGEVKNALTIKGEPYKLSDEVIRHRVVGPSRHFDVMADQAGFNSRYAQQNAEYVVLRGWTGDWRYDSKMSPSETPTTFQSFRRLDDSLAWEGNLICDADGFGINCNRVAENNPAGGAGCMISMGIQHQNSWHHFYMGNTNTDTYLYICNGAQHSSGSNMNHRFWIRSQD
mmetsp:Transcript_7927/g.24865  ORF Transcript_7927/g.24865 Transcript_7927/m.24865 type:complete len:359 (-) Transcript_7927:968-2044(-)